MANDETPTGTVIDRANRMLRQSQILRKLADELLQESNDLRRAVRKARRKNSGTLRRSSR